MQRLDVRASVNAVNAERETALLKAARMEKWETVRDLLGGERVADEVDVHMENKAGNTCLVLIMLARLVLSLHASRAEPLLIRRSKAYIYSKRGSLSDVYQLYNGSVNFRIPFKNVSNPNLGSSDGGSPFLHNTMLIL